MSNIEIVANEYIVETAEDKHFHLAETICKEMEESAKQRGTGIAKRSPVYIQEKMAEGKAIIATTLLGEWVGFCYIETWEHGKFVANSGLIVHPDFRKSGIAKAIKLAGEITTTAELAEIVKVAHPKWEKHKHAPGVNNRC